ncbi:MAG: hypothetical protein AAF957_11825 [Planctomycetota bacterium]
MRLSSLCLAGALSATLLSSASAQLSPYTEDFEGFDAMDPAALDTAGWLIFANVFDPAGNFVYGYGVFGAPNGGPGFSSLASSATGTPAQGAQQINIYSDYGNGDHGNGLTIEANVFREQFIDASNVGQTWTFAYDVQAAPPGANGEQDSEMFAFIKVLESSTGTFAELAFLKNDTTPATNIGFDREQVRITIDPAWAGELLQIGFASRATNFADTGRYYDNLSWSGSSTPKTATSPTILYTDIVGAPASFVPGTSLIFDGLNRMAAIRGDLSTLAFTGFIDSPNSDDDEIVFAGGALRVREGDDPAFTAPGDLFGAFDDRVELNRNGDFVFQNNTVGDASTDDMIVMGDSMGNLTLIAREGDAFAPLAGTTVGSSLESANIDDNGTISYYVENVSGGTVTADTDNFIVTGNAVVVQKGVTPLTGDTAGEFLDTVDLNDLIVSENGQHWLARGDLTGNTSEDDCLIVDGEVVIRELQPLPGGLATEIVDTIGIFGHKINNNGSWIARGDLDPPFENLDWVVIDGNVIARSGDPIHPGTTEAWSDSIFGCEINDDGDYLIAGVTDNADGDRNAAIVLNGQRVVAREGDPVDVDGNGLFDDDAFLNFFAGDDMILGNRAQGLVALFNCTARDASGSSIGESIFRIELGGVIGSTVCNGQPNSTGVGAQAVAFGSTQVVENDLTFVVCDLPAGSMGYFGTSAEEFLVVNPGGSQGDLCIASLTMGRYVNDILTADATGVAQMVVDLTAIPQPTGTISVMAGDTRYWQMWYRDTSMGMPTSNFTEAIGITFE